MLTERADVDALIRAIRRSREIGATEPMAGLIEAEIHPGSDVQTDEELEAWIRRTCEHTYHPACTARIGPEGDGVVDPELRVHGVDDLRVADASVLPVITRANTNAPAIMVGERCASFIRGWRVRILFVCLGNICRSPTAEAVMRGLVAEAGLDGEIEVESAGTGDWHIGHPPDERSVAAAAERGVELTGEARQVGRGDFG